MEQQHTAAGNSRSRSIILLLILVGGGILINRLGARLVLHFQLPLYLDSLGTILASAVGGIVPGVLVGFLSNLIGGILDVNTAYYSSTSVLIAVAAAHFARKGSFKKPLGVLLSIVTFALIGGGLGSVLTWLLYGQNFSGGISDKLAHLLYDRSIPSVFWAQFTADILLDLADKALTVLPVVVILNTVSGKTLEKLHFYSWHQAPLSAEDLKASRKKHTRGISLQGKILLVLGGAIFLIAMIVTGISFMLYRNAMIEQEARMGSSVAKVAANLIDAGRVDEFIRDGEASHGYKEIDHSLLNLYMSNEDIAYIYVYQIREDGCHVVFDVDTPDLEGASPGEIVEFDESFREFLPELLAGKRIDPLVTDDTYGWLLTFYEPVYDSNGVCKCYAGVDISMAHVRNTEMLFLTRVVALFVGFFVMILVLGLYLAQYHLILPVNSMSLVAERFAYDSKGAREESVEHLTELRIETGDEIENLYKAFTKTTEETMSYIAYTQKQNEKIAKMQNGLIFVLADMVESRDKCTGNHIRNTASYAQIILDQMKEEGIYADYLTDEFCNDVVNSAPLHDVGKIQVPDAILNKPGKLTDEEFDIMKGHAAAGGEIIDQAILSVSEEDSGYLKEAKNLAACHHEKWNGTGYPNGLKGEEIPLSARIMAVADVFDALVSKRSYKDGFPFDKAMDIIKEGSGTHFDPNIVKAFVDAEDKVREVSESKD